MATEPRVKTFEFSGSGREGAATAGETRSVMARLLPDHRLTMAAAAASASYTQKDVQSEVQYRRQVSLLWQGHHDPLLCRRLLDLCQV